MEKNPGLGASSSGESFLNGHKEESYNSFLPVLPEECRERDLYVLIKLAVWRSEFKAYICPSLSLGTWVSSHSIAVVKH